MIPMFGLRELAITLIGAILLLGAKRLPDLVRSATRPIGKPVRPRCGAPPPGRLGADRKFAQARRRVWCCHCGMPVPAGEIWEKIFSQSPSKTIPHQRRPLP